MSAPTTVVDGWVIRNEKEANAVDAMRAELGDLKDELADDASHNLSNESLVRYARLRKFNHKKAVKGFRETAQWRKEKNPRHLAETFDAADALRKFRPGGIMGRCKEGCPIYYDRLGQSDVNIIKHVTAQELTDYEIQKQEVFTQLFKNCSEESGKHIYQMFTVQDLSGLGRHHMSTKTIELVGAILNVLDVHYPLRFRKLIIVNPPFIFSAVWTIVKRFVSEATREQVLVASGKPIKTLEKYIDRSQIPKALGGDLVVNGDEYCNPPIIAGGRIPKDYSCEPSTYRDTPSGLPLHIWVPSRQSVRLDGAHLKHQAGGPDGNDDEEEEADQDDDEDKNVKDMFAEAVDNVVGWVRDLSEYRFPSFVNDFDGEGLDTDGAAVSTDIKHISSELSRVVSLDQRKSKELSAASKKKICCTIC